MATPTIKKLRKALGLSQEAFARAIGKSYASVRNYEDGRTLPPEVLGKMLGLAVRAQLGSLAKEIEKDATELYGAPVAAADVEAAEEETPEDGRRIHALLDYILNAASPRTVRALCETLRLYSVATRCLGDPFLDVPLEFEGPVEAADYRVLAPISIGRVSHKQGDIVTLDLATAKAYADFLQRIEINESQSPKEERSA